MSLYAAGAITEYWVLDVNGRQLLVYRDPTPDPATPHRHSYAIQTALGPADSVTPLAAPNSPVRVSDLLP
jgi:hypothetical protein